jgi:Zn-dependent membrane protease YugP
MSSNLGLYLALTIPFMILGFVAQSWVKKSFATWSQVDSGGPNGADVARRILDANGLAGMPISVTPGELSDHYDPRDRSIHLSQAVAGSSSVASVAVAAHECGHAIQHAKGMASFKLRGALAGPVGFASQGWMFVLFGGVLLHSIGMIQVAIALYALVVLFYLVTLPVEFDASRRAMGQLQVVGLSSNPQVVSGARRVLSAAAMTYVVAALAAIAQLVYFVATYLGGDR